MKGAGPRLLSEVSYYPDYMRFTTSEMTEILDMFWNVIKSIWQSVKLLTATLELNLRVVVGTWTKNRKMIDDAYGQFQKRRENYDKETAKNLEYFKKYYVDEGPGPQFLAFVANPLLFAAGQISTVTAGRASGAYLPYDIKKPISSTLGIVTPKSDDEKEETKPKPERKPERERSPVISPRLMRALEFFEYDASLREAVVPQQPQQPQLPEPARKEMLKLQSIARDYVESERKHAAELLREIAGISSSLKKITDAKDFDELTNALKDAEKAGLKVSINEIVNASKKIRAELEKQQKETPDELAKSVDLMRKKSADITDKNPVDAAMKFIFGMSKSTVQQQLINTQEEVMANARKAMNLPINPETRLKLNQSEAGQEYLGIVDNFEKTLQTGETSTKQLKSNLKSPAI